MNHSILKIIINNLYDKPLELDRKSFFVNRDKEIDKMSETITYQPQGIYGICGETGVGKTSLLKQFMENDIKSYFIPISEKQNKNTIICDLIYRLSSLISKEDDKKVSDEANKLKEWVITETANSVSLSGGINVIGSAGVSKTSSKHKRFNIFEAKERLNNLLKKIISGNSKVLLIIDELDKEKKDEVLLIVDSIKEILFQDNLITIISLPFSIYREYTKDVLRWNEWGNLENIFRNMIFVRPLDEINIREMILKRISSNPTILPNDAFYEIYRYSDGNPRDALSITQEIILDNKDKEISNEDVIKTIKKRIIKLMEFSSSFTDLQTKFLKLIAKNPEEKTMVVKKAEAEGITKSTVYTLINRFLNDGLIKESNGKISISGRLYYYFI
jgi:predicted KAP-like P-loop ATPase